MIRCSCCYLSVAYAELVPDSQHFTLSVRAVPVTIASSGPPFLPLECHALLESPTLPDNPKRTSHTPAASVYVPRSNFRTEKSNCLRGDNLSPQLSRYKCRGFLLSENVCISLTRLLLSRCVGILLFRATRSYVPLRRLLPQRVRRTWTGLLSHTRDFYSFPSLY